MTFLVSYGFETVTLKLPNVEYNEQVMK